MLRGWCTVLGAHWSNYGDICAWWKWLFKKPKLLWPIHWMAKTLNDCISIWRTELWYVFFKKKKDDRKLQWTAKPPMFLISFLGGQFNLGRFESSSVSLKQIMCACACVCARRVRSSSSYICILLRLYKRFLKQVYLPYSLIDLLCLGHRIQRMCSAHFAQIPLSTIISHCKGSNDLYFRSPATSAFNVF